jgi:hypothetical protein
MLRQGIRSGGLLKLQGTAASESPMVVRFLVGTKLQYSESPMVVRFSVYRIGSLLLATSRLDSTCSCNARSDRIANIEPNGN